jgi:hypothetical protein
MKKEWIVKKANMDDINRWFDFVKTVLHDFYDIDLVNDRQHRNVVEKNIKRKTAIYVEKKKKSLEE